MNDQPIVYNPYKAEWMFAPLAGVFLAIIPATYAYQMISKNMWAAFMKNALLCLVMFGAAVYCFIKGFTKTEETIMFYEDRIVLDNIRGVMPIEKMYGDLEYAYYCESYRHVDFLVLSPNSIEKKVLRKMANKNIFRQKIFIDDIIMIRINHYAKEKQAIDDLIRRKYPKIIKVDWI